jgi:hypothetical protein
MWFNFFKDKTLPLNANVLIGFFILLDTFYSTYISPAFLFLKTRARIMLICILKAKTDDKGGKNLEAASRSRPDQTIGSNIKTKDSARNRNHEKV